MFFTSSYCTFYALCFIFSVFCVFHCYSTLQQCAIVILNKRLLTYLLTYLLSKQVLAGFNTL